MNALTPIASKIVKLVKMLTSSSDGEVVNAARAIVRTLENSHLDIHVLADAIEGSGDKKFSESDALEIYQRGVEAGKRAVEDARYGSGDWRNTDGSPNWEVIVEFCHQRVNCLPRDNERSFVLDMASRTVWREPTERQGKWLLSIFYKLGGQRQ